MLHQKLPEAEASIRVTLLSPPAIAAAAAAAAAAATAAAAPAAAVFIVVAGVVEIGVRCCRGGGGGGIGGGGFCGPPRTCDEDEVLELAGCLAVVIVILGCVFIVAIPFSQDS